MVVLFLTPFLKNQEGVLYTCGSVSVRARAHTLTYEYTWYCSRQGCLSDFCQSLGTRDKSSDM